VHHRLDKRATSAAEQLALSPQCGFGGLDGISIPEEDQWRKFERVLETSRLVCGGNRFLSSCGAFGRPAPRHFLYRGQQRFRGDMKPGTQPPHHRHPQSLPAPQHSLTRLGGSHLFSNVELSHFQDD
jgi:hypothetical protein